MKKILFFSTILVLSCSKSPNNAIVKDLHLAGNWILTETLADPRDGSGKWTKIDKPDYYFIKFNPDSIIATNIPGRFETVIKYIIKNDSTVSLIYSHDTTILHYKINDTYLTITGGCIEACGSKFKAGL